MSNLKIVQFKPSDIDVVFEIQQKAYKPLYDKYHDDKTSPYTESKEKVLEKYTRDGTKGYIFTKKDIPVGAVKIILLPDNTAKVSALAVLPEYQGQGIAYNALLEIESLHGDIRKWILDTILEEPRNCHLYEKLGYKKTGKIEKLKENMTIVDYEK